MTTSATSSATSPSLSTGGDANLAGKNQQLPPNGRATTTTSTPTTALRRTSSQSQASHDRSRLSSSVHATSTRDSDSHNSSGFAHIHLKDLVRILHDIKPPTIVGKRVNDANEVVELVSLPSKRVDEVYP